MEANLLPYVVARISQYGGSRRNEFAMASVLSPTVAVTTRHALPVLIDSPSEMKDSVTLEFPHRSGASPVDGKLVHYDYAIGFAVIELSSPVDLPTGNHLVTSDPVQEGSMWETVCFTSSGFRARAVGRIDGSEIVDGRALLRLSVDQAPKAASGILSLIHI